MMTKKKRSSVDSRLFEGYWTVTQLAARRGVTVQAIRKAIYEGRIAASKLGHYWLIRRNYNA